MNRGVKPFSSVDLILISHIHKDHFDASSIAKYLNVVKDVVLFTTPQVADSVLNYLGPDNSSLDRIKRAQYTSGYKSEFEYKGIRVKIGKIAHGSKRWSWIQNAGHIISIGGKNFLHIGDPYFGEQDFKKLNLSEENIDVAILPVWFLTNTKGREIISNFIKPKHLIAVHVSPGDAADASRKVAKYYPNATVFTKPMQSVEF